MSARTKAAVRIVETAPPVPKAYSYIRLSTAEQLKGDGLRRMEAGAEKWAEDNAMPLDETLRDIGISAFTGANTREGSALYEFKMRVDRGLIAVGSVLVLESLDRMSRQQLRTGVRMLLDLLDAGIDIVTLGESGFRFRAASTGMDQLVELLLACVSLMRGNDESTVKSERVSKAWITKRTRATKELRRMTHLVPGWIRCTETGFELIQDPGDDRAAVLREIFENTVRGIRPGAMAIDFNRRSIKPFGRSGRGGRTIKKADGWYASYIKKILDNRSVLGEMQPGTKPRGGKWKTAGEPIKGYYPAAIDEDLWYRAQHARQRKEQSGGRSSAFRSLFRGLTFCGATRPDGNACTSGMEFEDKGRKSSGPKFVCGAAKRGARCTHHHRYSYAVTEATILFGLQQDAAGLLARESERREQLQGETDSLAARLGDLKVRQERLVAAIENGATEAAARLTDIRAEAADVAAALKAKEAELRSSPDAGQTPDGLTALHAALQRRSTPEERRDLNMRLRRLVRRIDFVPHEEGGATVIVSFVAGDEAKWFVASGSSRPL